MVFTAPSWVPKLPEIPDTVSIPEFMFDEKHGRTPFATSLDPYVDGLSGRRYTARDQKDRVEYLARALSKEFDWKVNQGTEFDKVAAVFAYNTIDILTINWAIHRLNGISSPANAVYSADELAHQLKSSGSQALFTVLPLLEVALRAAKSVGIPPTNIYICEMPGDDPSAYPRGLKTLSKLIETGKSLPELEASRWSKGQGARQTAFLCFSSGTSGLPKGVMISHRNVIANTIQITLYESKMRHALGGPQYRDVALGLLPQSHIYGLVLICHVATYRGDSVIVLPKFDLNHFLESIQTYKITSLFLVPPLIITMIKNQDLCAKYDLSSVRLVFTGAAPLGKETADAMSRVYPAWAIRQGYGMTETCTLISSSSPDDLWFGSSGSLLPGFECRVMSPDGEEITTYDKPGELLVKSPSITLGYLNNEVATRETYVQLDDGLYLRTGDEVVIGVSPQGNEHVWVVDRIKELIKVKGHQVAPAELESCLLDHPYVADCAVIPVLDDAAGEIPKAYVVKSPSATASNRSDADLSLEIQRYVLKEKARYKQLKGGVEFIDVIPKSPSGKILRRMLRDKERAERKKAGGGAKL